MRFVGCDFHHCDQTNPNTLPHKPCITISSTCNTYDWIIYWPECKSVILININIYYCIWILLHIQVLSDSATHRQKSLSKCLGKERHSSEIAVYPWSINLSLPEIPNYRWPIVVMWWVPSYTRRSSSWHTMMWETDISIRAGLTLVSETLSRILEHTFTLLQRLIALQFQKRVYFYRYLATWLCLL